MLLLIFFIFFEAFYPPFREAAASLRREKEYITHARFVSSTLLSFFRKFLIFLNFIFTARYGALLRTPCLWQGSCVSSPRCGFASQTREILLCAFAHVPACGRDPACLRHAASLLRKLGDFTVRFCARPCLWQGSEGTRSVCFCLQKYRRLMP